MDFNILAITSSCRAESISSLLVHDVIAKLKSTYPNASLTHHDLAQNPIPLVTGAWIAGAYSDPATHSEEVKHDIGISDRLVDELLNADAIVIGVPMYNLSIPAALKAWVDQIVRSRRTFDRQGAGQYQGLVPAGKKVYLCAATGDTPTGSDYDGATAYMKDVLGFIGLTDITIIAADQVMSLGASQVEKAKSTIAQLTI